MPLSTVLLARLSILSLLSALLVTGASPAAQSVLANGSHVTSLNAHATSPALINTVNPAISLTATAGPKGYRLAVSGSGFAPNSTITVAVDGSGGQSCTADATGSFSACAYAVPPETGGTHTLTASDGIANSASAMYTASAFAASINPRPPANPTNSGQATNTGDNPTVRLSSGAGKVGSNIAVSGSGFEPHQDISLSFDGNPVDTECSTKGNGSFRYCVLTIPAAAAGTHTVTASDDANAASTGYTVNPGISLTPSTGPVGSSAAVSGSGFDAYAHIALAFDGNTVSSSCTADATGSFRYCAYTVPAATQGRHTVTASDYRTNVASVGFYHAASALYTVGAAFSLNPSAGAVGSTVMLSGSNYAPNSTITVTFDGDPVSTSGTCTTDAKGNLPASNNCAFTVPTEAAGAYNVTTSDGTYSGTTPFTVKPAISLTASAGAVDSEIALSGSGFASFDPITVSFDGSNVSTDCTADATGSFSFCSLTVPNATGGTHTVTATDPHGDSASASYTVNPAIELTSDAGAPGSSVALTGSGFKANATIAVTFDGKNLSKNCTTDANGSISPCALTIPAVASGIHTVTASDGTTSASASYTIGPAISLNPIAGAVGSAVTLSGSNYTPNSTLTVTFDGAALGTFGICTTDANGNLPASNNCAFTVPATTAGSDTATVSDGTYSSSATFTVNPAIGLIPSAGPGGSVAAASGSGFTPFAPIALTFDSRSLSTFCTSNATGSISACAFTVPAVAAGIHTVTATDGTAYSASAIFTVTPALSLNPTVGAAGSIVTLSGSSYTPKSSLIVTFDGAARRTSGICTTDASGYLLAGNNCTFTVPITTAGIHTVTVSDGTYSGSATFTVIRGISLLPSVGPVGSSVAVTGSGFTPRRTIGLTFGGGSVPVTALGGIPCITDASGRFSACAFTVPATTAGSYTVTAWDGTLSASASYTVKPVIWLTSSAGTVGSTAAVNGSGFAPFAPISVNVNGRTVSTACTANASGGFSGCTFTVPAAPAGPQTVTASDGTTAGTTTATYTVNPAISLASSAGAAGSSAAVSGTGFARKDKISLTFDGGKVSTSCTTDATGSFSSCTFTVPAASAGIHNVAASDSKADSASASYIV
jgi:hypothetical protein